MQDAAKPEQVTVLITWTQETGQIEVNGPLNDEMVMIFLLEKAKDIAKDHIRRARAPMISAVPLPVPRNIRDLKN